MTGAVERIGLKSTRIRAVSGEELVMSNANLLNTLVQNWSRLERRRVLLTLQLIRQTPPDTLAALPQELCAIVTGQPLAEFDRAHVTAFMPSSIDIELVFFVRSPRLTDFLEARQAVLLAILRRFAELGVHFAYPAQAAYTAAPDGRLIMP